MNPSQPHFPDLTRSELAVIKVLWKQGALSARELHGQLAGSIDWAYSTTRTTIERMVAKGLISKRRLHGLYIYEPKISKVEGLAGLARELAERILEVDYAPVVSLLAEGNDLTAEEVEELSRLLEKDS